ncbi:MAG: hypothetical protein Q4D14_07010 [Bacteroidales bacterium]|nr:hypothetical protein [Bacteroidales bacterium]
MHQHHRKNSDDISTNVDISALLDATLETVRSYALVSDEKLRFNYLSQVITPNSANILVNALLTMSDGTEVENAILLATPFDENGNVLRDSITLTMGAIAQSLDNASTIVMESNVLAPCRALVSLPLVVDRWSPITMFWKPVIASGDVREFQPVPCENKPCNGQCTAE